MAALAHAALLALGMNVHLPSADVLDLGRELGVEWVRIDFNWNVAEPTQGRYEWAPFDAVIDAARARGLRVFATVGYGPAWASASHDRGADGPDNDVPDAAAYARFVRAAAERYANGRVAAWGTWNEPNLTQFFEGTRDEWIASVFAPAVDAIRAGCPSCAVVGPELATIGDQYADYLAAALASRGDVLTAVSMHIYAPFPEQDSAAGFSRSSFYNKLEAHRVLTVNGTSVDLEPASIREAMLAAGRGALPLWITETGREAAAGDAPALAAQQRFVELVLGAMACRPWWQHTFFYELTEEHPMGLWPDIHWGLALRVHDADDSYADNFARKPAYDRLRAWIAAPPTVDCSARDAGADAARSDAGAARDASAMDGGTGAEPGGVAGSGCACRAARGARPGARGWSALGALGVAVAAARRRRRLRRP